MPGLKLGLSIRDRIDRDVCIVRGGDRILEARLARDLLPVREQHEDAGLVHVGGEELGREDDRVVESGASNLVDFEPAQR